MKILIADDENLARSTLKSMLQELRWSLESIKEATNGEEMVELVRHFMPDVAFVDIKMPKLNGLEAIKRVKELSPDTTWFILSGFSEFSYAQEALRLGASDYLLKPIDLESVRKAMDEGVRESQKHLQLLNKQFERDIISIYHGLSSIKQEDSDSFLKTAHFAGAVFYSDSHLVETAKAERQQTFLRYLQTSIDTALTHKIRFALFALPNGELAWICAWESTDESEGKHRFYRCLDQIEQILPSFYDEHFCITPILTSVCLSYAEFNEKFTWIQKFSPLRALYGIGKKLHQRELVHMAKSEGVEISQTLVKLGYYYREKMYLQYMHTIDTLVRLFPAGGDVTIKKRMADFLCHVLPCQIPVQQDMSQWKQSLQSCGDRLLLDQRKKDTGDSVEQVIAFIEQNYCFDVGIAQIAEKLHVTPNYLSALFHKKTGTTFMKYLTRVRMLKAKELLADPHTQVQQVAEQVGYYSSRHFTKVFTAFFGYYPSDQRKSAQRRDSF